MTSELNTKRPVVQERSVSKTKEAGHDPTATT